MTELLLEASGVAKNYGAVAALRDASLAIRPGEIHALMGANGAGKSTLVKILTGAVKPDGGTIVLRGKERTVPSPAEARRSGMVSVYQEPAIILDLTVLENLALTETPVDAFRSQIGDLGIAKLNLRAHARDLPLATLRIIDLARALAIDPDVLLLDEMTAALPADLTARVLEVISRRRGTDHSVIFISHRMLEVAGLCDRATVLREGRTVGVVDVAPGAEEQIVGLMLGPAAEDGDLALTPAAAPVAPAVAADATPRLSGRNLKAGKDLADVSFDLHAGEVLGLVALEGQGQDELFDVLSGQTRPSAGEILVDGAAVQFRHPSHAIRAGVVLVPADRSSALLMQRSVRENIALPRLAPVRRWGPLNATAERRSVARAIDRLQIDTRAHVGGAPALGRQPAEGDDRALAVGRRPHVPVLRPNPRYRHSHEAGDLPARARAGGGGCGRAAADVGAGRDPACLRPRARHLRRTGGGRDARVGGRRADAPASRSRAPARRRRGQAPAGSGR